MLCETGLCNTGLVLHETGPVLHETGLILGNKGLVLGDMLYSAFEMTRTLQIISISTRDFAP